MVKAVMPFTDRYLQSQLPHRYRGIAGDDCIRFNAFRNHRSGGDNRVLTDGDTFQDDRVHADPNIVPDFYRSSR